MRKGAVKVRKSSAKDDHSFKVQPKSLKILVQNFQNRKSKF